MSPDYFQRVERAFLEGAGRGLMLSARDIRIVDAWARAGIPVEVVEAGVHECFTGNVPPRVRGLAYVVPAVDDAIRAWRQRSLGSAPAVAPAAPDEDALVRGLADRLRSVGRPECDAAADAVLSLLGRDASPEALAAIEAAMCASALASLPAAVRSRFEDRAESGAMLRRALREHFGLPRCVLHRETW